MKIKLLISALLISCTTMINGAAFAQTRQPAKPVPATRIDPQKVRNIQKLMEITGAKEIQQQLLSQIFGNLQREYPNVPNRFWESFAQELKPDELFDQLIPIYAKYYTNQELEQLIAFYDTPVGKKTIQILPQLSAESADVGYRIGKQAAERAIQRLEAEGYLPNRPRQ
jgi:hypothetical protein